MTSHFNVGTRPPCQTSFGTIRARFLVGRESHGVGPYHTLLVVNVRAQRHRLSLVVVDDPVIQEEARRFTEIVTDVELRDNPSGFYIVPVLSVYTRSWCRVE
jgi:hypothetical protein